MKDRGIGTQRAHVAALVARGAGARIGWLLLLLFAALALSLAVLRPASAATALLSVPETQLLIDMAGQAREKPGELEVRGRQYEAHGAFLVNVNGGDLTANEIKVISDLRVRNGVGEHKGTIDVDIDTVPGGHLTLEYRGSATADSDGSHIVSSGEFKVIKATDSFGNLTAQGVYMMTITEMGIGEGSPALVTISAISN
ncbi:MAG: hypothetical protein HY684_00950 [Chloroflexi bacterium]|nr:hypothetical protein [Chloroflexota bacterium]